LISETRSSTSVCRAPLEEPGEALRAVVRLLPRQARRHAGAAPAARPQTPDRATWYAPPFKVFDNLYCLGTRQHSSWALQTSAGLILIDTNFAWATEPEIIQGLTSLGLNPRDLKYVVISHAHGDHDQGAAELQKRFGAKVVMGAPDWESTLQRPASAAGGVPTRDLSVGPESTKLSLGDTTVEIVVTPGHTPGTLSYVFPVRDQGRVVMVAYSGGTLTGGFGTDARSGMNTSTRSARSRRSPPTQAPPSSCPTTANMTARTREPVCSWRHASLARLIPSSSAPTACSATSR
jgi:glyoxylase-like metal-dependent hydrolase (beta-lactamase superfamily II)